MARTSYAHTTNAFKASDIRDDFMDMACDQMDAIDCSAIVLFICGRTL